MLKLVETPEYPDWLDQELWQDFIEYREEIKKPLTEVGKKRAIKKLRRLMDEGGDQTLILERTINSSALKPWTGIFQAKPEGEDGQPVKQTKLTAGTAAVAAARAERNHVRDAGGGDAENVISPAQLFPSGNGDTNSG